MWIKIFFFGNFFIDVVDSESVWIRVFMYIGFIEGVIVFIIIRWIGLGVVGWIFVCIIF